MYCVYSSSAISDVLASVHNSGVFMTLIKCIMTLLGQYKRRGKTAKWDQQLSRGGSASCFKTRNTYGMRNNITRSYDYSSMKSTNSDILITESCQQYRASELSMWLNPESDVRKYRQQSALDLAAVRFCTTG